MPDSSLPQTASTKRGFLPRLVGLFALGQIIYFPLANLMEFVPQRPTRYDVDPPIETTQEWGQFTSIEPLQWAAEAVGSALAFWGEVTGQEQGWNMFTPGFPPYTVVSVVEFHFPDGTTDRLHSRFNPSGVTPPDLRAPLIYDREFNYEANVVMLAWHCEPKSLAEQPDLFQRLPEKVRENEHLLIRWLSWHVKRYRDTHPEKPTPTQVVLLLRYIPITLPGDVRLAEFERPFARWFPNGPTERGFMSLEGYAPVAQQYMRLKVWKQP